MSLQTKCYCNFCFCFSKAGNKRPMRYECFGREYILAFTDRTPMQSQENDEVSTVAGSQQLGVALNLDGLSADAFNPDRVPRNLANEQHLPTADEFPIHPDITQPPGKICKWIM